MARDKHLPDVGCSPFVRLAGTLEHGYINHHYGEVTKRHCQWKKSAWLFQMKAILPLAPVKAFA
jgi:hypothetical protein